MLASCVGAGGRTAASRGASGRRSGLGLGVALPGNLDSASVTAAWVPRGRRRISVLRRASRACSERRSLTSRWHAATNARKPGPNWASRRGGAAHDRLVDVVPCEVELATGEEHLVVEPHRAQWAVPDVARRDRYRVVVGDVAQQRAHLQAGLPKEWRSRLKERSVRPNERPWHSIVPLSGGHRRTRGTPIASSRRSRSGPPRWAGRRAGSGARRQWSRWASLGARAPTSRRWRCGSRSIPRATATTHWIACPRSWGLATPCPSSWVSSSLPS